MSPIRVQRRRTKGWRTPLCSCGCGKPARYVGRGSKWGNPFVVGLWYGASGPGGEWSRSVLIEDRAVAVAEYRRAIMRGHPAIPSDLTPLRGHDLMCWCPLGDAEGVPCHADILLELANQGDPND